ncbi:MAG TPA: YdeI/OmpD-associated family protein [Acidimicrobiales bacterium]|nr:YdeI/OmpD-associated family protein [Acidimicrobiales bacterium]
MPAFRAVIESHGKSATGIEVPAAVVEALGQSKRPKVQATVNGYTYRSSVGSMGGRFLLGVSAEVRAKAGVAAGHEVDVSLELDTDVREVAVPDDFAAALAAEPTAQAFFAGLSYSQQRWFVEGIESAKKPETRQRRIEQAVARLAEGRGQR